MLTKKQKIFYDGLIDLISDRGYFPSVREIGRELGFSSPATVHSYLDKLISKKKLKKSSSGWEIVPDKKLVPLVGLVPAGSPFEIFENLGEKIQLPELMFGHGEDILALRVTGDSMKDAYIQEDDIVVIKKCSQADSHDMVVAILEDSSITLKRLKKESGKIYLIPENPEYEPIFDPFQIAGKVIGVIRKYR